MLDLELLALINQQIYILTEAVDNLARRDDQHAHESYINEVRRINSCTRDIINQRRMHDDS